MKAVALTRPAPIESAPLRLLEKARPEPSAGEILVRVSACGVCRTDLHLAEGDLEPKREHTVPGHEVVGVVEALGEGCSRFGLGARVGIAWLRETCGTCAFCRSDRENLCPSARFTGWDADGGYAEYAIVREDFAYAIPEAIDDEHAAPLLCAGIIGYRAIKRAGIVPGATVGLYGFGASAHLALQVLKAWGCRVFVMSRGGVHRDLADELGADWIGEASDPPPAPLDAAILFAPAGNLVPEIMRALSIAEAFSPSRAFTDDDSAALLRTGSLLRARDPQRYREHARRRRRISQLAGEIPVKTHTDTAWNCATPNEALRMLKHDELRGAAVLLLR